MQIVVAGGGVAGLASALILARAGHRAILVEQDPLDYSEPWPVALTWPRKGIPHFHQPHFVIPRGRQVLRAVAPDVYDVLLDAGATELDVGRRVPGPAHPADADLVYLGARRELIEWALRGRVRAEPGIVVRAQTQVAGLIGDAGPVPRIRGVRTTAGEAIQGDLVVDALGRRSPVPGWLPELGGRPPAIAATEMGAVYYSRFFTMRAGASFPDGPGPLGPRGDLGYAGFTTLIGDNHTFAVVFVVPTRDRELRALRAAPAFLAACQAIASLRPLTDPDFATPLGPVQPMGSLQNLLRSYTVDGRPVALGLFPAGDAFCHTDPSFALGLAMSLVHPAALAAALAAHPTAPADQAGAYFQATLPEAAERFALASATDDAWSRVWQGEYLDATRRSGSFPLFTLVAAGAVGQRDPEVFRRLARRNGFLDRTAAFDDDVALQEGVEQQFAAIRAAGPRPPSAPARAALLPLLGPAPAA